VRRERELIRAPPVRVAQASFSATVSMRRPDMLSPGGLQRRFGNQGAQMVLHAVATRSASAQQAAPQKSDSPKPTAPVKAQPPLATAAVPRPEAAPRPDAVAVPAQTAPVTPAATVGTAAPAAPSAEKPQAQPAQPTVATATPAGTPAVKDAQPVGKAAEPAEPAPAPNPAQAVAPVAAQVRKRASKARTHSTAGPATELAQASGKKPTTERTRAVAQATVVAIEAVKPPVESFREKLIAALKAALPKEPKNADEAKRAQAQAKDSNAQVSAALGTISEDTTGGLEAAAQPGADAKVDAPETPQVDLVHEETGPAPAPVAAGPAVPPPAPPPDLSEDRAETDSAMADAGVTKTQLAKSNEPEFTSTLQAREDAEKEEAQRAQQFETGQSGIHNKQENKTAAMLSGGLATIHGCRDTGLGLVAGQQTATKSAESKERERVTGLIQGIKDQTRIDVLKILADMESSAKDRFGKGLEEAEKAYENAFEENKGGAWNWLTNWGDDWKELIEESFKKGRAAYDRIVTRTVNEVADIVERELARAKARVEQGRKAVDDFVAGLEGESKRYGDEARKAIETDFNDMDGEIDSKRDDMVTQLVDQYRESQKRVAALEEKLRAANKSLWERIYDATVGIIKKIIAFKDFLLNVLARVAQVVSAIIDDPIGFLGNLIGGIIAGLERFKSNIWTHLKKGLLEWLFGALEGAGIKLPETFDLKGIVGLVMQILGLTWENVRARAVKILGADTVAYLEKSWEIFQVLIKEGPAGLWKMLVEKVGDIKDMIITQVGEFVKEKIIFAGIKWVLSLLNPVAAFIKACMAIYDIVKFFIERAEQIAALINAILDTLGAIVRGNISAMATSVENALAKLIPVAIGFLASLLNLGGISDKIRNVIMKLRQPVNAAIDWIIGKAAALVKKGAAALFGGKKEKKAEKKKEDLDPETSLKVKIAIAELHRAEASKGEGGLSREEAQLAAQQVKTENPVIKSISIKAGKDAWVYVLTVNPTIEEESQEPKFRFSAADIEEAKARAMEIVRRHRRFIRRERRAIRRMDDPMRVVLPAPGAGGVVGDVERRRYMEGKHGFGYRKPRTVELGRETDDQPAVISQEKLQSKIPETPNIHVKPSGAHGRYEVAESVLAARAREYGLNQGQFMEALNFYRTRGQLPDHIAVLLGPKKAADLRIRIGNLLLMALHAESFRLGHAQATAAVSIQTMSNQARKDPDKEVSAEFLGTLGSKTPHGGTGGAPAGRRSEAMASGEEGGESQERDEAYAQKQVAHMEAYFRSDPSLFKRITTVPALAKHIARLIIQQLGG